MDKKELGQLIAAARGTKKADLVLKNGLIFNVFTGELERGDIAILGDRIAGICRREDDGNDRIQRLEDGDVQKHGDGGIAGLGRYEGAREIDVSGKVICPGLIDGHIHIESSMISPEEFAKAVLPHGTTAVITDPHEIANVAGQDGIRFMMESSRGLPVDVFFMLPSCVPATKLDESGATLAAKDLKNFYGDERVLGLAELMNAYGTVRGDEEILAKILDAREAGKVIDGHGPGLAGADLNAYLAASARSDHECSTAEEAIEKIRRGQWIMVREGTAAKNLKGLLPLFEDTYFGRCMLVTDDKHPGDLLTQGHIDHIIREAVAAGKKPENAIRMATLHTATYFGLKERGAIAPGYLADLIVVSDLKKFKVEKVFKAGQLVAENGNVLVEKEGVFAENGRGFAEGGFSAENGKRNWEREFPRVYHSFHMKELTPEDFVLKGSGRWMRVMELIPGELLTREKIVAAGGMRKESNGTENNGKESNRTESDGTEAGNRIKDIIKIAVIERHHNTGHMGVGLVAGYGLKQGAIASSIAHDSHNLIVAGTNDVDMAVAANAVRQNEGGLAIAVDGKVLSTLALPLGGLMCERDAASVEEMLAIMKEQARRLGVPEGIDPFMTLAFTALPVIPKLRILTGGLVDVEKQSYVPVTFD